MNVFLAEITLLAFKEYIKEVKAGTFPDIEKHCYKMLGGELEKLISIITVYEKKVAGCDKI